MPLAGAVERSPFYRRLYAGHDITAIDSRESLARLPLIDGDILREQDTALVCLPQTRIERISSMLSSGSTGRPKCIYFSAADLEHTVDFFDHGMRLMCGPDERVMICMNGATPYSVGDLLSRGLRRFGAEPHIFGEVSGSNLAGSGCRHRRDRPAYDRRCAQADAGAGRTCAGLAAGQYPAFRADNVPRRPA